jgi:hypothetical protein
VTCTTRTWPPPTSARWAPGGAPQRAGLAALGARAVERQGQLFFTLQSEWLGAELVRLVAPVRALVGQLADGAPELSGASHMP